MTAYYNEIDPYAAQWLRNLISKNLIAPGDVDERSIVDVQPDDLKSYSQCHFFAGIGGWSLAARMAGWPDDRPLWTGSCPCQPFSAAGKGEGQADERHLWPVFFSLISARRPDVVMGEQVAAAVGKDWLDGVHSDLEGIDYTSGAAVVPACAVDAPHRRDRLWFVAHPNASERGKVDSLCGRVAGQHAVSQGQKAAGGPRPGREDVHVANADISGESKGWEQRSGQFSGIGSNSRGSAWIGAEWLPGADGKARRFEPGIRLLAHGVPARMGKLRAYGNAIVPQVAAEVIGAYLDLHPDSPSARSAPSFDPLLGSGGLPLEQGNEQ